MDGESLAQRVECVERATETGHLVIQKGPHRRRPLLKQVGDRLIQPGAYVRQRLHGPSLAILDGPSLRWRKDFLLGTSGEGKVIPPRL